MFKKLIPLAIVTLMATSANAAPPIFYSTNDKMPFSDAVQLGDILYLSGQIGVAPNTNKLVDGGIGPQAKQTLENIGTILKARGLDYSSIFKCTVMLSDINDWQAFNAVYVQYFKPGKLPARSAFAASGLAYNGKIELECWAYSPQNKTKAKR